MMGLTNLSSRDCGGPSVFHWFSPFPLEPSLEERLVAAGLRPAAVNGEVSIDLLLYDTPDAVLNHWRQQNQPAHGTQALVEGYRHLSQRQLLHYYRHRLWLILLRLVELKCLVR